MNTRAILFRSTPLLLFLIACGGKRKTDPIPTPDIKQETVTSSMDTTIAPGYITIETEKSDKSNDQQMLISSIAALPYSADTTKKFIKTAKIKFKVKDMLNATYAVEDITRHFGGFITYTSLETEIRNTEYAEISEDSILKRTHYAVVNNLTLRIPATRLDSALRNLTPLIEFLDYRTITAEDISLKLLTNHLAQLRIKNQRVRIDRKSTPGNSSLEDITYSEEALLNRQEQADASLIENLSMMDQVKYSTVELSIYQDEKIKMETVYNPKSLHSYNSGFGYKMKRSFNKGWHAAENFIIFITQFWILFVLAGIVLVIAKLILRSRK